MMDVLSGPDWSGVFVPDQSLFESFTRGSLVYLALVVLFRVVLKRQSGSLGLPDVMLVVLVSECVSNSLSANANSVPNALVTALSLLFWNYALDRLAYLWPWFHRLIEPDPLELVKDGHPIREALDAEGVSDDELAAQLRQNGIDDVAKVKSAVMESEGSVSVIERDDPPSPAPNPPEPNEDEPLDIQTATDRFLAAAAVLRHAVRWHEQQATNHRDTAKAARGLLQRAGVRASALAEPRAQPKDSQYGNPPEPAEGPAARSIATKARPRFRDGPEAEVSRAALQGVRETGG